MYLNELLKNKLAKHGLKPFRVEGGGVSLTHDGSTGLCSIVSGGVNLVAPISEIHIGYCPSMLFWNGEHSSAFAIELPSLFCDRLHGLDYQLDNEQTAEALRVYRDNPRWITTGRDSSVSTETLAELMAGQQEPRPDINWQQVAAAMQQIAPLSISLRP